MINECNFAFDREEREHAFNSKHQKEWEYNWQESLERWKALGAYIGEYHHYPMPQVKYVTPPPALVFKSYEEERIYALNKVLTYLEKEFIK